MCCLGREARKQLNKCALQNGLSWGNGSGNPIWQLKPWVWMKSLRAGCSRGTTTEQDRAENKDLGKVRIKI